jgi:DNA polymerase-3 subunit alpha/error-prone DNA polymerase
VLDQCHFEFEFKTLEIKKFYTKSKEGDRLLLVPLKVDYKKTLRNHNKEAQARVLKELKVISDLNFAGYFSYHLLLVQQSQGFMHVGGAVGQ